MRFKLLTLYHNNFIEGGIFMGKLLLTGVDGNLGAEAARVLLTLEDKSNLIFFKDFM